MEISVNISNNCAHIAVTGMLDTLNAGIFNERFENLVQEARDIELDLERVSYISSSGLRTLIIAANMAGKRGGVMKVVKSSEFVREIITEVGLDKLFSLE